MRELRDEMKGEIQCKPLGGGQNGPPLSLAGARNLATQSFATRTLDHDRLRKKAFTNLSFI
jgi:hypothetical protein